MRFPPAALRTRLPAFRAGSPHGRLTTPLPHRQLTAQHRVHYRESIVVPVHRGPGVTLVMAVSGASERRWEPRPPASFLAGGGMVGAFTAEAALSAGVLGTAGVVLMAVGSGGDTSEPGGGKSDGTPQWLRDKWKAPCMGDAGDHRASDGGPRHGTPSRRAGTWRSPGVVSSSRAPGDATQLRTPAAFKRSDQSSCRRVLPLNYRTTQEVQARVELASDGVRPASVDPAIGGNAETGARV